jgi:hypothetical protein
MYAHTADPYLKVVILRQWLEQGKFSTEMKGTSLFTIDAVHTSHDICNLQA